MKAYSYVICFILLCLVCGFGNAFMIYQNDTQLIRTSDQIVYGKIIDVKSAWNAQKTQIETTAQILVDEAFIKNNNTNIKSGSTISVTTLGGTVGDISEWVEEMPVFELNSDAFVYLEQTNSGEFTVHGLYEGIHPVFNNKSGTSENLKVSSSADEIAIFKEEINKTLRGIPVEVHPPGRLSASLPASLGASGPIISSISPSTASAGTNTLITITGSGFGPSHISNGKVMFFSSVTSYSSGILNYVAAYDDDEIVSWTDTQIRARVPVGASSGFVKVRTDSNVDSSLFPFAVTFSYGKTKWDTSPTFYVNPGSVSGFSTSIQNAAATWNNAGSSFRLNYDGASSATTTAPDFKNNIFFGLSSDFAQNNPAITHTWYYTANPEKIIDCDTEFNPDYVWTTGTGSGNTMNIEAVMTHEFGHWLRLIDLYGDLPQRGYPGGYPSDFSPEIKMMFNIHSDSLGNMNLKTLSSADIAGIRWIYGETTPIPNAVVSKTFRFGMAGDTPVSGDWDGDDISDAGVFRNSTGTWYLETTQRGVVNKTFRFGISGDTPVVGDWNNDGNTDVGVYRPSTGTWYLETTKRGVVNKAFRFGISGDTPVVGDWNNDGNTDVGVYRPSTGTWYLETIQRGVVNKAFRFGLNEDIPVVGDWNNDGNTDVGVYRPSTGTWYLETTRTGVVYKAFRFGLNEDIPVVGDWNADGTSDVGVYRPSTGTWYLDTTKTGVVAKKFHFGISGDVPVIRDWNNNGYSDISVFRPSNGNWYINYTPLSP
ncbi:MAG: IPT/TIG domain-containing protein [Methanoregula sp.]|jgi:hypothetical protein|nr:IPT/TIG domain-containing protein [Methanoregula sp.]